MSAAYSSVFSSRSRTIASSSGSSPAYRRTRVEAGLQDAARGLEVAGPVVLERLAAGPRGVEERDAAIDDAVALLGVVLGVAGPGERDGAARRTERAVAILDTDAHLAGRALRPSGQREAHDRVEHLPAEERAELDRARRRPARVHGKSFSDSTIAPSPASTTSTTSRAVTASASPTSPAMNSGICAAPSTKWKLPPPASAIRASRTSSKSAPMPNAEVRDPALPERPPRARAISSGR